MGGNKGRGRGRGFVNKEGVEGTVLTSHMLQRFAILLLLSCSFLATVGAQAVFYKYLQYGETDISCLGKSNKYYVHDQTFALAMGSSKSTGNCYPYKMTDSSGKEVTYYLKMTCDTNTSKFSWESYTSDSCSGTAVGSGTDSRIPSDGDRICEPTGFNTMSRYQGCATTEAAAKEGGYVYGAAPRTISSWILMSVMSVALYVVQETSHH